MKRSAWSSILLPAALLLATVSLSVDAQVAPKPKLPKVPTTPGGTSGNRRVEDLTAAMRRAPFFEDLRLLVSDCRVVQEGLVPVLRGRVRRRPGGDPIGSLDLRAVLPSGEDVALPGNARRTGAAHDGLEFDASDTIGRYRGQLPIAYNVALGARTRISPRTRGWRSSGAGSPGSLSFDPRTG